MENGRKLSQNREKLQGARISQKGTEYQDIYYNEQAQRMVVEWFVQ